MDILSKLNTDLYKRFFKFYLDQKYSYSDLHKIMQKTIVSFRESFLIDTQA